MALTREQVLSTKGKKLPRVKVPVPEWAPEGTKPEDAYVWVKTMAGTERDKWEKRLGDKSGNVSLDNIRSKFAVAVCEDDDERQVFNDQDVADLGAMTCVPLGRIFDEGCKLNGIGKQNVDELLGESSDGQS